MTISHRVTITNSGPPASAKICNRDLTQSLA
jgi:hypothetical protein